MTIAPGTKDRHVVIGADGEVRIVEVPAVRSGVDRVGAVLRGHGAERADDRADRELDVLVEDRLTVPDLPDLGVRRLGVVAQHADVRDQRDVALFFNRDVDDLDHQRVTRLGALDFDRPGQRIELGQRHRLDKVILRVHLAEEPEVVRGLDNKGIPNRHPCQRLEVMLPLEMQMLLVSRHPLACRVVLPRIASLHQSSPATTIRLVYFTAPRVRPRTM